jgi:hypothetical protein
MAIEEDAEDIDTLTLMKGFHPEPSGGGLSSFKDFIHEGFLSLLD